MIIYFPVLILLIGLIVFILCKRPESADAKELGRIMFFCGLLAVCLRYDEILRLLKQMIWIIIFACILVIVLVTVWAANVYAETHTDEREKD